MSSAAARWPFTDPPKPFILYPTAFDPEYHKEDPRLFSLEEIDQAIEHAVQAFALLAPYVKLDDLHIQPRLANMELLEALAEREGSQIMQSFITNKFVAVKREVAGKPKSIFFTCPTKNAWY